MDVKSDDTRTAETWERVRVLLEKMVRKARVALVLALVGAVLAVVFAVLKPRRYRSEAVILYREGVRFSYLGASDIMDPARKVGQRLKEIVMSRHLLQQIMEEHKLYRDVLESEGTNEAIERFRKDVTFRAGEADTITISYEAATPELAQLVTASLAAQLVQTSQRLRMEQASVTSEFLDEERKRAEQVLTTKEHDMSRFLAEHPEFAQEAQQVTGRAAATGAGGRPGVAVVGPESGMNALEREAARLRARINAPVAAPGAPAPAAPAAPAAPVVDPALAAQRQTALAEVAAAQRDLNDKQTRFTAQHPDVRAAEARVRAAEGRVAQVDSEIRARQSVAAVDPPAMPESAPAAATPIAKKQLEARLAQIEALIAKQKASGGAKADGTAPDEATRDIVALETDWQRLSREVTEAREHYKQLQDKTFLASVAASATQGSSGQMVIVDPAFKPTKPTGAGRGQTAILGIVAAGILSLGVVFLLALLDDRLYRKMELESAAMIPVLCEVPRAGGRARG